MGDFTDNTDNTFTDILENPVQEIQTPADSSDSLNTPTTDTGTTEPADVQATPTPTPENETPVPGADETKEDAENSVSSTYTIDDIYALLSDLKTGNETYHQAVTEYQSQTLENQTYFMEQTRNILSVSSLILLTVGFVSGILLARVVWRKL